ncbi:MAG: glucosyltransferase domain-containing protein, partial [Lachnospiraceae bacterium]|nr:glucosyltransferase domain-containing protein [Lachnospiraceae bacterium]
VTAVYLTKKYRLGFLYGAICLAFSMGIYQAYLPFAILLCIYQVVLLFADGTWKADKKALMKKTGAYLGMGILGFVLYYVILRVLLLIQGKELASYQGIGEVGTANNEGLLSMVKSIYLDFASFTLKGGVFFQNIFSLAALLVLALVTVCLLFQSATKKKWWKHPGFYGILLLLAVAIPPCTSCIRLVSPELNYHLLMRYQWVLFPMLAYAFCERCLAETEDGKQKGTGFNLFARWALLCAAVTIIFCYGLADNVAYTNLEKKYEKTYAYCLRLLDRIEQTPGYYQGIPVALVGVVGEDPYPVTDLTGKVTGNMIGLSGDYLIYTGENYEAFIKNYLGATLNIVDVETMGEIYYSSEYVEMESFPAQGSTKVVNGILYVKTENSRRD